MADKTRLTDPVFLMVNEIMLVNGRIKSVFAGSIAATGVSSMAYAVFTMITESHDAPTVPQIGRSLGHARQVIQRAANELIAAGLIETFANPRHKRAPLLRATELGERFKRESDARVIATEKALLEHVDAAKCERIGRDLRELRRQIEAYLREGPAPS